MKFREYGEIKPLVLNAVSPTGLENEIETTCKEYDMIDLQFSTAYDHNHQRFVYSALLLVKEKEEK